MSQQNKTTLQASINTDLADNTTGDISASDIRGNLINITDSLLFNSGSQTFDGTLSVNGTVSGSFEGDGSGLTGVPGSTIREYGYYELPGQEGFSTGDYVTTGINLLPAVSSSTFSVSYDSGSGVFDGFTSGKLYELEFAWLTKTATSNDVRFNWEKDGSLIGNTSVALQESNLAAREQTISKAAFTSNGTEDIKLKCTIAGGGTPRGFDGTYSFLVIKEI